MSHGVSEIITNQGVIPFTLYMSKLLWTPSEDHIKNSNMWRFINFINDRHKLSISSYEPLYNWSIKNITDFWSAIWEFVEVRYSRQYDQIVDNLNNRAVYQ